MEFGESSFDNALPWTQVKAAEYSPAGDQKGLLLLLLTLHEARVSKDKDFRYLQEDIAESKLQRKKNLISLSEAQRRKERDAQEARLKSRDAQRKDGNGASYDVAADDDAADTGAALRDDGLQPGERDLAKQLAGESARKNVKDLFLNEAVAILGDVLEVLPTGGEFAARVKPVPAAAPN